MGLKLHQHGLICLHIVALDYGIAIQAIHNQSSQDEHSVYPMDWIEPALVEEMQTLLYSRYPVARPILLCHLSVCQKHLAPLVEPCGQAMLCAGLAIQLVENAGCGTLQSKPSSVENAKYIRRMNGLPTNTQAIEDAPFDSESEKAGPPKLLRKAGIRSRDQPPIKAGQED